MGGVLSREVVHFGLKQPREQLLKENKPIHLRHSNTFLGEFSSQRLRSGMSEQITALSMQNQKNL